MEPTLDLSSHLSNLQIRHLAQGAPTDPTVHRAGGGLLFTDFTGFTRLADQLAGSGPRGAETLSEILNRHFGPLIAAVTESGGDVLAFAGDALVALFEADGTDPSAGPLAATRCALAVQHQLRELARDQDQTLGLRATVGAGSIQVHHVGGVNGQWLAVAGGAPLTEIFDADRLGRTGQVLATSAAWRLVQDHCVGDVGPEGVTVVRDTRDGAAPLPPAKITINEGLSKVVEAALPSVLRQWSSGGVGAIPAEFREASLVFVTLPDLDPGVADANDRLHQAACAIQEEVARLGGTFYQMLHDDKSTHVVAAFGLPGQARDDDAARAAEAAVSACARAGALGLDSGAGVASGPVFCGAFGGAGRSNYGIFGATINRAARLMQEAAGRVLCDEATRARAERWFDFAGAGTLSLKGLTAPVSVHEAVARRTGGTGRPRAGEAVGAEGMIGRARETERLRDRIVGLGPGAGGGAVVVEAEAGVGKTTLLGRAQALAREARVRVLEGAAEPIEENTAYFAFRPIARELLRIPETDDTDAIRQAVRERLTALGEDRVQLAPLLNAVLPLDLPENDLTRQMAGSIRAQNLSRILSELLGDAIGDEPVLLALEDAHWMDGASLGLCVYLAEHVPAALLVVTARPMDDEPPEYTRLKAGPGREVMHLGTLEPQEIVELVRRRLQATSVPVAVKRLIQAKAEGNPFYGEELAVTLRESGAITVEGGECRIVEGKLGQLQLPGTVKGIVTGRIDRLDPTVRATLKTASVAGRVFDRAILDQLYTHSGNGLEGHLDTLVAAELIVRQADGSYSFRHALTHETAYGLLPFSQREPLHRAAAEHLEAIHEGDLSPVYARLAFHWSRAGEPRRALPYLGAAGQQALEAYANQAAVEFFSEAIRVDRELRGELSRDLERARLHRLLAESHYSLMQWDMARQHFERAIELCGFRRPRFGLNTPAQVGRHILSRFAPRIAAGDPTDRTEEERALCTEALLACENLQVVYLWQGNQLSLAHTVFEGANIAARLGPSAESAFARAMIGYLLVMAGMRKVAERDLRAAVEMAEASGQLLQQVSCNMYLGMTLSLLGRPLEGIPYLSRADELVGLLGGGLWKHRGKYMLAEPHLMIGDLPRAAELFAECAAHSMSVEPPITGFANAMQGLCWIRQGRVQDALELIRGPAGIQLVRDNPLGLQLYNTLGARIEGCLWTEEWTEAFEAGREAVAIPEKGDDANSFFTGYNGHAAVARLFLTLIERRQTGAELPATVPDEAALWGYARRALKNFRKAARQFPGGRAPYLLVRGLYQQLNGRSGRARSTWLECVEAGESTPMPYERAMALYELGRHADAPEERDPYLKQAEKEFEAMDMPRYARRCSVAGPVPA